MEAKKIVAEEVARQAKFGMEPSWEDFVIAGQKVGIRHVLSCAVQNGYLSTVNGKHGIHIPDELYSQLKKEGT